MAVTFQIKMEAIINEITKEVSVYFEIGSIVVDLLKNDAYEIREANKGGLLLEHKPAFRGEQKKDLPIGYDELAMSFSKDRFFISGFSSIVEGGNKHDLEKLKRAIKDTRDKIELEERFNEAKKLTEEKELLSLKRKTKRVVRQVRADQEFQAKEEAERIEAKIVHDKKIKILNLKKISQQQRLRFFNKNI